MTTTIGTQMRPYVVEDTSTQEKEAVPCDFKHVGSAWLPTVLADGPCPHEATHVGICTQGDFSINACEECANHFMVGGLKNLANGSLHFYTKKPCEHAMESGTKSLVWFPR